MKKIFCKILCLVLTVCMLLGAFPAAAFADEIEDTAEYYLDDCNGVLDGEAKFSYHTVLGDSVACAFGTTAYTEHTKDVKFVLDDEVIPGSYADLVNKAFGIDKDHTFMGAHCGWRTNEFLRKVVGPDVPEQDALEERVSKEFYSGFSWASDHIDSEIPGIFDNIKLADLITVSFGSNDYFTYALMSTIYEYEDKVPGIDLSLPEQFSIEDLCAKFVELLKFAEDVGEIINFFVSKCEYGLAQYKKNFPLIIKYIRENNPNAKIVVLGGNNPANITINKDGKILFDFFTLADGLVSRANFFLQYECPNRSEYLYVDTYGATYYGFFQLDLDAVINGEWDERLYSIVKVVHPDEYGHATIAERIINGLKLYMRFPQVNISYDPFGRKAELKWNRVNGALSYRVYRSTEKYSGYRLVGATALNKFTDFNVSPDTLYYYRVVAVMSLFGLYHSGASDPVHFHVKGEEHLGTPATCSEVGRKTYWICVDCDCEKKIDNFGAVLTDLEIPATGHIYDRMVESDDYLVNSDAAATCTQGKLYYYSCVCGEHDCKTFEGAKASHNFTDWKECGDKHIRVCQNSDCGALESHAHNFNESFICEDCGYINETKQELAAAKLDAKAKLEEAAGKKPSLVTNVILKESCMRIDAAKKLATVKAELSLGLTKLKAQYAIEHPVTNTVKVATSIIAKLFGVK